MDKSDFKQNSTDLIGKVKSKNLGTQFTLYNEGQNPKDCKDPYQIRKELGVVKYNTSRCRPCNPR